MSRRSRNYADDKVLIGKFLRGEDGSTKEYTQKIEAIASRNLKSLYIELDEVEAFDDDLCQAIEANNVRYQKLFYEVIDESMEPFVLKNAQVSFDSLDVFLIQRLRSIVPKKQIDAHGNPSAEGLLEARKRFPAELLRRYEVYFISRNVEKHRSVRSVRAIEIGHLVSVIGVVTRCTEVKPLVRVATYTCDRCGSETFQEILNASFMPLALCASEACKVDNNCGRLHLQTRGSRFLKFQELRVQELPDQVPVGNIPRSVVVLCRGENTRLAQPGDQLLISGVFLPVVRSGFRQLTQGLLAETYIEAHAIQRVSRTGADNQATLIGVQLTDPEKQALLNPDFTKTLVQSVAPEIYGHDDIKKALLLLLVGGVDLAPKGMKIRGTINLCLMGDPGVAKSQLLSFVHRLCPRSQYTTGRGSSGVGLTAAVLRDPITGEMTLEGGALVLADRGVCCIDEFDKMAEHDRTAIHEVMEQQTISIAKAGILTTLNARVSILAAANPAYGRYNSRKTVEQNIDLPAALLSRFDLLWLIQDKPNREHDMKLARHIIHVHQHNQAPAVTPVAGCGEILDMGELRRYIEYCRQIPPPRIPEILSDYLVGAYVEMRKEARNNRDMTYTSARTLLAILRLASALSRLHVRQEVTKADIDEAMRLMESSRASIYHDGLDVLREKRAISWRDEIYQIIRDLANASPSDDGPVTLKVTDIMEKCASKGFKPDRVNDVIDNYEDLNVWQVNNARTRMTMVA